MTLRWITRRPGPPQVRVLYNAVNAVNSNYIAGRRRPKHKRTYRLFRPTPQRPGWRCHSEKIRLTPAWTCSVQSCCQAEQIMVTDCSTSTYTKLVQHETSLLCWCLQTAALAPRWYTADWRHRQQRWHKLCEAWWWLDLWSLAVDMASRTVNQTW